MERRHDTRDALRGPAPRGAEPDLAHAIDRLPRGALERISDRHAVPLEAIESAAARRDAQTPR